ncbi:MAG: acetaldehyde dehydrogenase (acetylating) [Elusimicrobia bacterium]|nr:acetaldehyde dehydrogenase (acetylating) [Elusimicrobiota bacterium]MBU2615120.1 acetaldehyde dehydrogenase (acetylating) [Elusimicrobiota bacterium]
MHNNSKKLKVAIIGSGLIGTDLLVKLMRSNHLECSVFIGRNTQSRGMTKAISLGVPISDKSIDAITSNPDICDIVFDCTSASGHKVHAPILEKLGKIAIDLTPANVGKMCVPAVNLTECLSYNNVNMITCGGQASIPLAYVIGQTQKDVDYIEVVSTISSRSAGPATRANLDEYIETTEKGLAHFSGAKKTKAILVLNPAQPCINMQTTVRAYVKKPEIDKLNTEITKMIKKIQTYVPGYSLVVPPMIENNNIILMIRVQGLGDYLPSYAGNLDIINCAAIAAAEEYAKSKLNVKD